MSKPQHHIDEAWVQRYQEGKLSEEEQRWLKENPFEAEALEGLAGTTGWSEDIPALQQQLRERTSRQMTLWASYGRYAAAVALLFAVGWVAYQFVGRESVVEQPMQIVQTEEPVAAEDKTIALSAPDKVESEGAVALTNNEPLTQPKQSLKPVPVPKLATDEITAPAASSVSSEPLAQADEETPAEIRGEVTDLAITEPSLSRNARMMKRQANIQTLSEQLGDRIVGSVFSTSDQSPLPGVNVVVKGTLVGTVTDMEGRFSIPIPDSSENTLVFSFIGFQSEEMAVRQQDSLIVALEPDEQALSEVVVTGYGKKDKSMLSQAAHPVPTRKAFREYLQNNLQYPQKARQQNIEGTVKVQFMVEANGELTDFTIKKSLGYSCDEEAIRLIKNGPAWQPAFREGQPRAEKVTVKVRFAL